MTDFGWNRESTKSRYWDAEKGEAQIKDFSPKHIVSNPNYHQMESVVAALCKTTSELIALEEERHQRMLSVQKFTQDKSDESESLQEML